MTVPSLSGGRAVSGGGNKGLVIFCALSFVLGGCATMPEKPPEKAAGIDTGAVDACGAMEGLDGLQFYKTACFVDDKGESHEVVFY